MKRKKIKPVSITITIDPTLLDFVDESADRASRSRSNMIVQMLRYYQDATKKNSQ